MIRLYRIWLASAAVAVVGLVLTAYGLLLGAHEVAFVLDGAQVRATVTAKTVDADNNGAHHVRYTATLPGGRPVEGDDIVGADRWSALSVGEPLDVDYVRSDPTVNRVAGNASLLVLLVVLVTGIAFAGAGGGVFLVWYREQRRRGRLAVVGVPVRAKVVEARAFVVLVNSRASYRLRYEYGDAAGRRYTGMSGFMPRAEATPWKGRTGIVRYDPRQPSVSSWFGDAASPPAASSSVASSAIHDIPAPPGGPAG